VAQVGVSSRNVLLTDADSSFTASVGITADSNYGLPRSLNKMIDDRDIINS